MRVVRVHGVNRAQRRAKARLTVMHDVQRMLQCTFREAYEHCKKLHWLGDYLAQ